MQYCLRIAALRDSSTSADILGYIGTPPRISVIANPVQALVYFPPVSPGVCPDGAQLVCTVGAVEAGCPQPFDWRQELSFLEYWWVATICILWALGFLAGQQR